MGEMYTIAPLRELLNDFASDPEALVAYWHHARKEMNMLDTAAQILHAIGTYEKQRMLYARRVAQERWDLLVFQRDPLDGEEPPVDPLALGTGYCVSGAVLILKRWCWACHKPVETRCAFCEIAPCCAGEACQNGHECKKPMQYGGL